MDRADHKEALVDVVATRAPSAVKEPLSQGSQRVIFQDYRSFVNFIKQSTWQTIREGEYAPLMEDLIQLGLRNPGEPTSQMLGLVILHQTAGFEKAMEMEPHTRHDFVKAMKKLAKAKLKAAPAALAHLSSLPKTPEQLLQQHPEIHNFTFASEGPVKSPIPELELSQLRGVTRMRARRGGASGSASLTARGLAPDTMTLGHSLMMQLHSLADQVQVYCLKRQPSQPLIRISKRVFKGSSPERLHGQLLEQQQLALPPPSPPSEPVLGPAVQAASSTPERQQLALPSSPPAAPTVSLASAIETRAVENSTRDRSMHDATLAILASLNEEKANKGTKTCDPEASATHNDVMVNRENAIEQPGKGSQRDAIDTIPHSAVAASRTCTVMSKAIATETGVDRKTVTMVLNGLTSVATQQVRNTGNVTIPGLCRLQARVHNASKPQEATVTATCLIAFKRNI